MMRDVDSLNQKNDINDHTHTTIPKSEQVVRKQFEKQFSSLNDFFKWIINFT